MRFLLITAALSLTLASTALASAQIASSPSPQTAPAPTPDYTWPPSAARPTLALWPGAPPDAIPNAAPEADTSTATSDRVAGRPLLRLGHVSTPTLTLYQPAANPSGAAIIVFPGGGYEILAIDLEGTEVCQWLNAAHITCILAKYRVPGTGPYPKSAAALDDAQRAVGLVRSHAADWHIDPHRIGVLGFSAGGHLAAAVSTHFDRRLYTPIDAADRISCRPDFAVVLYPGYLADAAQNFARNPAITPTAQTPPTFLLQAENDPVHVENAVNYFLQLKAANVPAELHIYAKGGHGYGLRRTALPITGWPALVETWLATLGMTSPTGTPTHP